MCAPLQTSCTFHRAASSVHSPAHRVHQTLCALRRTVVDHRARRLIPTQPVLLQLVSACAKAAPLHNSSLVLHGMSHAHLLPRLRGISRTNALLFCLTITSTVKVWCQATLAEVWPQVLMGTSLRLQSTSTLKANFARACWTPVVHGKLNVQVLLIAAMWALPFKYLAYLPLIITCELVLMIVGTRKPG